MVNLRRWLVIAIVAGCEAGSRFPPSDMSFETFCPEWQALYAALSQRCYDIPAVAVPTDLCDKQAAKLAAHRIGFDRSLAAPCLRAWQAMTCATFRTWTSLTCTGLEPGVVAEGGACNGSDECAVDGDSFCDQPSPSVCPGVCRTRLAVGDDCSTARRGCVTNAACVDISAGARCVVGVSAGDPCGPSVGVCYRGLTCAPANAGDEPTCLATLDLGDACAGPAAPCVGFATCGAGGTCVRRPIVGEACGQVGDVYVDCLSGWCDGAAGGSPGVCRAQLAVGAACTSDIQCAGASTLCTAGICSTAICPA